MPRTCDKRIILASGSPRRKELLATIAGSFDVIPSHIPETASGPPAKQVVTLAAAKATDIAKAHPDAVVIGADTLVAIDGRVLGKPKDAAEAADMLRLLSGKTHKVYTGVAVVCGGRTKIRCCATSVTFDTMTPEEIGAYIGTGEPMDKAGAYGIQGHGGKFIRKIYGCYYNVMGLPLNAVYTLLKSLGVLT